MKPLPILYAVIAFLVASLDAAATEESPFSVYKREALEFRVHNGMPVYEGADPNVLFGPLLLPNELKFVRAAPGQEIALNSVIVMPTAPAESVLVIEFLRADLREVLVEALFFDGGNRVSRRHPFVHRGIEATLSEDRLILKIHPAVVFHLRDDMEDSPGFRTFTHPGITGKITRVVGEVVYSFDPILAKIKLGDFYSSVFINDVTMSDGPMNRRQDGSYETIQPIDELTLPKRYPPKVIGGQ